VGGLGAGALFLSYSRGAETEADVTGARMMAGAGYDPMDMARFFDTLRRQAGRDPGGVERFLSDHPAPVDRAQRIRQEAQRLGAGGRGVDPAPFNRVRADLRALPPARPTQALLAR
jgi:predicted Zn-dependent protease